MIEIVSATRFSEADFSARSALGQSLKRLAFDGDLTASVAFNNRHGLPVVYNSRILAADSRDLLVFVHDDVWIDDYFFGDRIIAGLRAYDVIGLAGNRRRLPGQPGWCYVDTNFKYDERQNLSGAVAHGAEPCGTVAYFGKAPADCELLDGLLLAVRKSALVERRVLFDPQFDFHFYDLDFCRSARKNGLRIGTWPICVTHQSGGAFNTAPWHQKYQAYLAKWGS